MEELVNIIFHAPNAPIPLALIDPYVGRAVIIVLMGMAVLLYMVDVIHGFIKGFFSEKDDNYCLVLFGETDISLVVFIGVVMVGSLSIIIILMVLYFLLTWIIGFVLYGISIIVFLFTLKVAFLHLKSTSKKDKSSNDKSSNKEKYYKSFIE